MSSVMIVAVLWAAVIGGILRLRLRLRLRMRGGRLRVPIVTLVIAAIVTVVSIVGELSDDVLHTLGRDTDRLLAGEWWRAVTPLVVQDGGWAGLVFNVIALIAIGGVAEALFRRWVVAVVFVVVGLLGELAAYTVLTGQGFAGNSVANLGIAGVVLVAAAATPRWGVRLAGILGIAAGVVLVVMADLHAVGLVAGAVIGVVVALRPERYETPSRPPEAPSHPE